MKCVKAIVCEFELKSQKRRIFMSAVRRVWKTSAKVKPANLFLILCHFFVYFQYVACTFTETQAQVDFFLHHDAMLRSA